MTFSLAAGKLRAILDAFLADLASWAGVAGSPGGPCLQGFAAVAEHMLREQTSALQVYSMADPWAMVCLAEAASGQSVVLGTLLRELSSCREQAQCMAHRLPPRSALAVLQGVPAAVRARRMDKLLHCDARLEAETNLSSCREHGPHLRQRLRA